jgi:tetratricopeptide (TPR) repeat protein
VTRTKNGKQVDVAELTTLVYIVLADKDGRLKVRYQDAEGWFAKDDAVLLDNNIPYFTQKIKVNPNDDYAFALRAEAWFHQGKEDIALKDLSEAIRLSPTMAA